MLVAGGAGALGAAVLEQLPASHSFEQVAVLVTQPVNVALRGLVTIHEASLADSGGHPAEDTAITVFDRERRANGREQAFFARSRKIFRCWLRRCGNAACADSSS
jgi:hypothetical protein